MTFIVKINYAHFSGAQAALAGFSNLVPFSRIFSMLMASTAGYGILPAVNTSQHVMPNDHCIVQQIFQMSDGETVATDAKP